MNSAETASRAITSFFPAAARARENRNSNQTGTKRIHDGDRPTAGLSGQHQPTQNKQQERAGSTRLRRRLSKIFQRESSEIGFETIRPGFIGHAREQPTYNLPVAAQPAMLAPVVGAVMRGIVVDDFDIADQAGARVGAFDQVVAEQGISRKAAIQHAVNGVDFVDAFAGEDAFAVEILVNVRDGAGVDIKAGLSGVDAARRDCDALCTLTPTRGCKIP